MKIVRMQSWRSCMEGIITGIKQTTRMKSLKRR
jgi:hypothetical protein